jgi:hypothetical protein
MSLSGYARGIVLLIIVPCKSPVVTHDIADLSDPTCRQTILL